MRLILAGVLAFWLVVFSGWAAPHTRNLELEAQIEKNLGQAHPEVLESFRAARVALDKEDYPEATRLLREVCAKAPDCDAALRRLGACLAHQGQRAEGLEFCERALALDRSSENLSTLAHVLMAKPSSLEHRADFERALQLLREGRSKPHGTDLDNLALTAQAALLVNDAAEFHATCALMAEKYPNEMATHYFAAIQAALQERWLRAESEIQKAEQLGLPHETVQQFLDNGVQAHAFWPRLMLNAARVMGLWCGGLFLLFGLGFLLSKLTLRQVQQAEPQATVTQGERLIRKAYRVVLNVAGVYYYISLPVVLLMVIGVVGVILYLFMAIGRFPIKLTLLLIIGAFATIVAMVKSLFLRVKASDPGRPLQRAEAEGLWQLTEEVAQAVGTRPIDEIRITPGTELAVYERGTWREKLRNQAQRVLILGAGVLGGFKQNDFRCVLAHEYGHFSNRDTAGGDIALRVQSDMVKFYLAMRAAGQATYLNAAFHFLRLYNFIFRRISHGATRLQEILADRVAAQIYGAPAFEGGLTHVIRRSIEFEAAANHEIKQSLDAQRQLQNHYELPAPQGGQVATELDKVLNRPTTHDDTHPGPKDRFRLVARLQQPSCPARAGEVWELFNHPDAIRQEMVAVIEKRIAPHRGKTPAPAAQA